MTSLRTPSPFPASAGRILFTLVMLGCPLAPTEPRRTPSDRTTGGGVTTGGGTTGGATGDYSLTVDPKSISVPTGGSKSITVTASRSGGFTGQIELVVGGLPPSMTATRAIISPLGSSATITLSAGITNNFTLGQCVVQGQAAGMPLRSALFGCGFTTGAPVQGLTMSISPSTLYMGRNGTGKLTASVSRKNGYRGTVFFSVTGLPSAASASTIPGIPYNSTEGSIYISTGSSTPLGTYALTVKGTTATSQYLDEYKTITLVVR